MARADCTGCENTDTAIDFRCVECRSITHIHMTQWAQAQSGDVVAVACPDCHTNNAVRKPRASLVQGGRLVIHAVQQELVP